MADLRALIFGAGGQDGPYLAQACAEQGIEAIASARVGAHACDVNDAERVALLIRAHAPSFVFQLAADSRTSHDALRSNHEAIASGTLNVLEAVRLHAPHARVVVAGSGLQFVNDGQPIFERAPLEARSPYAAARIYATFLARYFRETFGVRAHVAYLFHHESPARSVRHTSMKIAAAAVAHAAGETEPLVLGDWSVVKEWAFAGDIAEAMLRLAAADEVFDCVVGTGEGHSIEAWAAACYALVGLDYKAHVMTSSSFVPEYKRLVSDPRTIRGLGWSARTSFAELARMLVDEATRRASRTRGSAADKAR